MKEANHDDLEDHAQVLELEAELDALWDYVESGPDNPDVGAFNEASAMRDRRLNLGTASRQ